MKIFIPEWADMVDPGFDFTTEIQSLGHRENRWANDRRIWELSPSDPIPVDGVLVSRMVYDRNGEFRDSKTERKTLREFLRLPPSLDLMGDCGAFGYVNVEKPPYLPEDTLEFYRMAGVDIGVTIDHLIVSTIKSEETGGARNLTQEEKERRWDISVKNALRMFEIWSSKEEYWSNFRLMGAIQGSHIQDFQRAAEILVHAGYTYIGVGGLVRSTSKEIREILLGIRKTIQKCARLDQRVDLHVFGVARQDLLSTIADSGVASIDSATMLRRAWMSAKDNYMTMADDRYTALRLPRNLSKEETFRRLQILRDFDAEHEDMNTALTALISVSRGFESRDLQALHEGEWAAKYAKTLKDRPWRACDCPICRQIGIEVMIFRGNDRNRRRGFHNVHIFYRTLRREIPHVAVVLSCSKKKDPTTTPLPAYARYLESSTFKVAWRAVSDLFLPDVFILSGKYGLVHWAKLIRNYDETIQDKNMPILAEAISQRLSGYSKIFFYGAGSYRRLFEDLAKKDPKRYHIFPSQRYANGRKLDIIELNRQVGQFRAAILRTYKTMAATRRDINAFSASKPNRQSILPLL